MDLRAFRGTGTTVLINATTASTANQLATAASAGQTVRVVNESAATALISISSSTSPDATADTKVMRVITGTERVFDWPSNATTVATALSSGTGNVSVQLGAGF